MPSVGSTSLMPSWATRNGAVKPDASVAKPDLRSVTQLSVLRLFVATGAKAPKFTAVE